MTYRSYNSGQIKIQNVMKSIYVDIMIIILILFYGLVVLIPYLDEDSFSDEDQKQKRAEYYMEFAILGIFILEIFLSCVSFGKLYLYDYWNIFDITIVISMIFMVIYEMTNSDIKREGLLKLRAFLRFSRIVYLV